MKGGESNDKTVLIDCATLIGDISGPLVILCADQVCNPETQANAFPLDPRANHLRIHRCTQLPRETTVFLETDIIMVVAMALAEETCMRIISKSTRHSMVHPAGLVDLCQTSFHRTQTHQSIVIATKAIIEW